MRGEGAEVCGFSKLIFPLRDRLWFYPVFHVERDFRQNDVTSSYNQRNFGKISKSSFKTDVALEHGFGKVLVSRNHRKTAKEVPREESEKERVQARIVKKDSKSAYVHGVCLLNHGFAGMIRKAA